LAGQTPSTLHDGYLVSLWQILKELGSAGLGLEDRKKFVPINLALLTNFVFIDV